MTNKNMCWDYPWPTDTSSLHPKREPSRAPGRSGEGKQKGPAIIADHVKQKK